MLDFLRRQAATAVAMLACLPQINPQINADEDCVVPLSNYQNSGVCVANAFVIIVAGISIIYMVKKCIYNSRNPIQNNPDRTRNMCFLGGMFVFASAGIIIPGIKLSTKACSRTPLYLNCGS